jgi:D-glycero-alpha-D-manno-heptose-7-phosphate kinase
VKVIESSAPTRVDLEGGTIDIWPLYLFHPGAITVNFAISLYARCRIETRDDRKIVLTSRDRKQTVESSIDKIDELATEPKLELLCKLVNHFRPETGFTMITDSEAPAGAGLAGSSTLAIACIGALNELTGRPYEQSQFIQLAANIETTVIKVPAGYQDYFSALYGGASAISFKPEGIERESITLDPAVLEEHMAICYTGEPRNSGINNWEVFKRHIDGDKEIFSIFRSIRDSASRMRKALEDADPVQISATMKSAYPFRKRLAPNITTPHMDMLVDKAVASGAEAAKVCGAGGGGCIAFWCSKGRRRDVEAAISSMEDTAVLDWRFSSRGIEIKSS